MNISEFEKNIMPITETGCWIWMGQLSKSGYGRVRIYGMNSGKKLRANRAAWEIYKGKIPDGVYVCHKCDMPSCVNPEHLYLGTPQDNMNDKVKKNRQSWGNNHPNSKISVNDVIDIRNSQLRKIEIMHKYGISKSHLNKILRGDRRTILEEI